MKFHLNAYSPLLPPPPFCIVTCYFLCVSVYVNVSFYYCLHYFAQITKKKGRRWKERAVHSSSCKSIKNHQFTFTTTPYRRTTQFLFIFPENCSERQRNSFFGGGFGGRREDEVVVWKRYSTQMSIYLLFFLSADGTGARPTFILTQTCIHQNAKPNSFTLSSFLPLTLFYYVLLSLRSKVITLFFVVAFYTSMLCYCYYYCFGREKQNTKPGMLKRKNI